MALCRLLACLLEMHCCRYDSWGQPFRLAACRGHRQDQIPNERKSPAKWLCCPCGLHEQSHAMLGSDRQTGVTLTRAHAHCASKECSVHILYPERGCLLEFALNRATEEMSSPSLGVCWQAQICEEVFKIQSSSLLTRPGRATNKHLTIRQARLYQWPVPVPVPVPVTSVHNKPQTPAAV